MAAKPERKAVNLCTCIYKLKEGDNWAHGVVTLTFVGLSDIISLIGADGRAIVAPDGGSCSIWDYRLLPEFGAISIPME